MSFIPNSNRQVSKNEQTDPNAYPGWPPLDTLYDYTRILNPGVPIGKIPDVPSLPVAIVGAGPAGLVSAYELLRMGIKPVIFEASDRLGGRNYTLPFPGSTSTAIAEMGAMRVPPSAKVFQYYAKLMNLKQGVFPDPGKVPTTLYYENQAFQWNFGSCNYPTANAPTPPGQFEKIENDWSNFIGMFVSALDNAWSKGVVEVQKLWQSYIDQYAQLSFYQALVQGIPGWGPSEFAAFGALGIGSGGFGPLYEINFLELLRIVLNQWETGQQLILGIPDQNVYGIGALTYALYNAQINGQSLQALDAVKFNCRVTGISYSESGPIINYTNPDGQLNTQPCSSVIVATTSHAMQVMGLTSPTLGLTASPSIISESAQAGLRDLHLMNSSKLFIRVPDKFWLHDSSVSWNIQTDEMVRGVYTLDYPWTTDGVVLISYTWGDDSDKLLAIPPAQRFSMFWNIINNIDPRFASYINPSNIAVEDVLCIDWQAATNYYGGFKLNYPGQEPEMHAAYYQFQSVLNEDRGVYLAGDSVSWSGGWTEGALETGLNAVCAVVAHLGGEFYNGSPLDQKQNLYHYGDNNDTPNVKSHEYAKQKYFRKKSPA